MASSAAPASITPTRSDTGTLTIAAAFAIAAIALHMIVANRYGYFRDEMYFLACARHLAWGYVDHAPLCDWLARLSLALFGDSMRAVRLLPAVANAGTIFIAGLFARELGGNRFAVALACASAFFAPVVIGMASFYTMNVYEPLFWMGAAYAVLLAVRRDDPKKLLWAGVCLGLGVLNKHSAVFFAVALVAGIALTRERRILWTRWAAAGAAASILIALPHAIWQVVYGFPILETLNNVKRTHKNVELGPAAFMGEQILMLSPASLLVWGAGLWYLFRRREVRFLAWTYVLLLGMMMAEHGKNYYAAPVYPMLFGAGGVWWAAVAQRRRWAGAAVLALVAAGGAMLMPLAVPLLEPATLIRYLAATHINPPKTEGGHAGALPQNYGDQFGWPEMVEKTAQVYNSLPPGERAGTAILAGNYGEAAAVDLFGPRYGLPPAISGHNNYWLWGPRGYTGETVIVLGDKRKDSVNHFRSCEAGPQVDHPYAMTYEQFDILLCRGSNSPLAAVWPRLKWYN